jgi:hypothetical protein
MTINHRLLNFALTTAFVLLLPPMAGAQSFGLVDDNAYYNGTTLTYYQRPAFAQCQADCANNPNCKAFTWIEQGTYKPKDAAMCYLLSAATQKVSARGHHSAVKVTTGGNSRSSDTLKGRWTIGGVVFYNFEQNGNIFTWARENSDEVGRGTINGNNLTVAWTGGGSTTGTITQRASNGQPLKINWGNGNVFTRVQ